MSRKATPVWILAMLVALCGPVLAKSGDGALDKAIKARDVEAVLDRMRTLATDEAKKAVDAIPRAYADIERAPESAFYEEDRYRLFVGAIRSLLRIREPEALDRLNGSFGDRKQWEERFLILHTALQNPALDPKGLALRGTQDEAPLVVAIAARTLGNSKDVQMLAPLLTAMERWETLARRERAAKGRDEVVSEAGGRAWLACRDALHRLTGKSFHLTADYRNYINAHRGAIDPEKVDLDPMEQRTGVGLFGLDITGRNIIFVLDISGSMLATDPPDPKELAKIRGRTVVPGQRDKLLEELMESRRRIVRAKKELTKVVESLGDDRRFNLVVYSTDTAAWKRKLVTASSKEKGAAVEFIAALEPQGVTFTDEALDRALVDPYVDTIYLITDGAPTHVGSQGSDLPPDAPELMTRILETTRARNYLRHVRLFTLGFKGAKEEWLTKLAEENHGVYHRID